MKDLIKKLNENTDKFPKDIIKYCQNNKEEVSDILFKEVERFASHIEDYKDGYCEASVMYAIFLLAEFSDKRLFAKMIEILDTNLVSYEKIFGEGIFDNISNILVSTFDGNLEALNHIIKKKDALNYVRSECLETYYYFYKNNIISKDNLITFIENIIEYYNYEEDDEIYTDLVNLIIDTHLFELMDLVRNLYQKNLIDTFDIGGYDNFVDYIFKYQERDKVHKINNVIDEMSWWYCFQQNEKKEKEEDNRFEDAIMKEINKSHQAISNKVGRNEPCPCGSGKKYKNCCINKKTLPYQIYIDESLEDYPKRKENEDQKDLYDFYSDENIEIDYLMYQVLCHKRIPMFIKRDYRLENEINIQICEEIINKLKEKLSKEHYETIHDYDKKNSIHYSLYKFIIEYTNILCEELEKSLSKDKYAMKLREFIDFCYTNFDLHNELERIFIDRNLVLYNYDNKYSEAIKYLEEKLESCHPNIKGDVYEYLFDLIFEKEEDLEKIENYIKKEKDEDLKQELKGILNHYKEELAEY